MKRLFLAASAAALLSCQSSEPGSPASPASTGGIALRIQATAPLRPVDSVKVVLTFTENQRTVTQGDSVPWDREGIKLAGLPLGVLLQVRMEGWNVVRGRRQVYWTAQTTTTLSKDSPAWDFGSGSQAVPVTIVASDTTGYVGPVLGQVVQTSRGALDQGVLRMEASAGVVDTVRFSTQRVDSIYVDGAPQTRQGGEYRLLLPGPDTLEVLLVGANGCTTPLRIEVAAPAPVAYVAGLGAQWVEPLAGAWVGASVPLVVKIDSGTVDSVVVQFEGSSSLVFQRDPGDSPLWRAVWEPAPLSVAGTLRAVVGGGGKTLKLPDRSVQVDLAAPRFEPGNFRKDSIFRVGKAGRDLEFQVQDDNLGGLVVWASTTGKLDSLVPRITTGGYALPVQSSLVLHARDRFGNRADLPVSVALDTAGPRLATLRGPDGIALQPGSGAVETSTGSAVLDVAEFDDPSGVSLVQAWTGKDTVDWDRQTRQLLVGLGTWTIETEDFLGNRAVWGTVLVRAPAPSKPAGPNVAPASGVYGADSLRWGGGGADTLVPRATCAEGTPQVQVDGKPWHDFVAGAEFWARAGGVVQASYRCRTVSDSSDPVARTWTMLHAPFLTYGGIFEDSIVVHRARNGILPDGETSTNPASAALELCAGDSAHCAEAGAVWVEVVEKDTVLRASQSLTARLALRDPSSGRRVFSRPLTRFYQRVAPSRTNWSPRLPRDADAGMLETEYGISSFSTGAARTSLTRQDSVLVMRVTWDPAEGAPIAGFDLPLDSLAHAWDLSQVSSLEVQVSDSGDVSFLDVGLVSDVYAAADLGAGLIFSTEILPVLGAAPATLSRNLSNFQLPVWQAPSTDVALDSVRRRVTGLRFTAGNSKRSSGTAVFRIHKVVLKGAMVRAAD